MDYNEYKDMVDPSYGNTTGGGRKVEPEDEIFKSIYLTGQPRDGEQLGKIQIRGCKKYSNQENLNMVILHHRIVNVKRDNASGRFVCFSFRDSNPAKSTTFEDDGRPRVCPANATLKKAVPFCRDCKCQIIISGILTDENGRPMLDNGKAVGVHLRGTSLKYGPYSDYIHLFSTKEDFKVKIFEDKMLETQIANPKKVVTKISVGSINSSYGLKAAIVLSMGKELPEVAVKNYIEQSKKLWDDFVEKFDWSKQGSINSETISEDMKFDNPMDKEKAETNSTNSQPEADFDFDDISF